MPEHIELRSLLARIRRRWFALTLLSTGGRATAAAAVPLILAALAAWLMRPSGTTLIALAAAALLGSGAAAAVVLFGMRRRPDDGQVARFIEEQASRNGASAALSDSLVSAVDVMESPGRSQGGFGPLIVSNAVRVLGWIEPASVIPPAAMRRASIEAIVGLAILAAASAAAFPYLVRAGATAWVRVFPQSVEVSVLTGSARVPAGHPLRIAATVRGRGAALLGLVPSLVVSADGQQHTVVMERVGGEFAYAFESVDRSFEYRVAAGASSSPAYSVTALFPPRVRRIDVRYEYPTFTGMRPRDEQGGGDIFGPAGTRVRLAVHTDKPVRNGEIALTGSRPVALIAGAGVATAELVLTRDDAYRVRLTDEDGLQSPGDLEYFIRVMDDRPPEVRIVRPSADQGITPLEEIIIEARADDDYGVAAFDLVYAVAGQRPRTVPFSRVSGTDVARVGSHLLAAEDLGVQPGDVVTYYARARDVARGKRSTETRSDIFFLEVKPFNEEFVAAQSQAMGGGAAGAQIDGLIAAQKEIISATWNLERRSAAGRSAVDVKAVGDAQAELKERIERMAIGGRRGARGALPPQQIAPPQPARRRSAADPVAAALDAMNRAIEQLHHDRTADAIPHEMAALQALLQAQAEVRQREVMQSSSAAGQGGTSRSDRDLSALFDRELQRQQRTNYEAPKPSTDAPRPDDTGDALERIRDLARRQEELARRQGELAKAGVAGEEKRRQLEQLTRDQQELRQQAEQLEKQMRGASGRPGASRSGEAGEVRRAAEQMQNAAKEMERQNAAGAAVSGERAAESLRQTERQLRGGSADARQRAAGDLQLEAQQVGEAQRRIASEMARLEKDGRRAGADALRRLAADKDKLADRVDELQRGIRELGRMSPDAAGAPFRNAAGQLQSEQVGARMRSTAKELRDRASSAGADAKPSQAQAEQQLSQALDGVVDTLGAGAQRDARRLSDELDRTRQLRERLDQLERRVRDAESQARGQPQDDAARGRAQQQGLSGGEGSAAQQLQRVREEYSRELQRARETLGRSQSQQSRDGLAGGTPEQHEFSRSAPGNEAFKQDFTGWEALRKDVDLRLDRYESAVSARLARKIAEDRLSAGGSERVPEAYRDSVSRYFESLAKPKK